MARREKQQGVGDVADPVAGAWVAAFNSAEARGNIKPLAGVLISALPERARHYVKDFCGRYKHTLRRATEDEKVIVAERLAAVKVAMAEAAAVQQKAMLYASHPDILEESQQERAMEDEWFATRKLLSPAEKRSRIHKLEKVRSKKDLKAARAEKALRDARELPPKLSEEEAEEWSKRLEEDQPAYDEIAAGVGFFYYSDWLGKDGADPSIRPWILACFNADRRGADITPFVPLIVDLAPAAAKQRVSDFFAGHWPNLQTRRGKPRTPAYTRSPAEIEMDGVVRDVSWMMRWFGVARAEAIAVVADENLLERKTVRKAYTGQSGARARMRKRLPPKDKS